MCVCVCVCVCTVERGRGRVRVVDIVPQCIAHMHERCASFMTCATPPSHMPISTVSDIRRGSLLME